VTADKDRESIGIRFNAIIRTIDGASAGRFREIISLAGLVIDFGNGACGVFYKRVLRGSIGYTASGQNTDIL
jgi:hypothetical protein